MNDFHRFYGFSENPFSLVPNPKFFFPSESHREALAALEYGISYRKGFILLLAEAGLGKTLLIRHLITTLDQSVRMMYFPRVQIPFLHMLKNMLIQLNVKPEFETKGSMLHSLYNHLIEGLGRQENVVLILDRAETIELDLLEEVRLLANLETGSSKLLQIVLVGRPELDKKLHADIVRQIEQRIVIHCRLDPLSAGESRQYIEHRLKIAGRRTSTLFTDEATALICKYARGVPQKINTLCFNALAVGYGRSEKRISASTVQKIRQNQDILTEEAAREIATRFMGNLTGKMLIMAAAVILLGLAIFFGKDYVQFFFNTPQPTPATVPAVVYQQPAVPKNIQPAPVRQAPARPDTGKIPRTAPPAPLPVSPPATKDAPEPFVIKKTVQVKPGDNLSLLAWRNYNLVNETMIDHIVKLNPDITNPHLLLPDQKIRIPEITESLLVVADAGHLYKIHLRTFGDLNSARQYRQAALSWAKETEIVPWKISTAETWYRVMTGPYTGRQQAMEAIERMKKKGFSVIPSREDIRD